MEGILLIVSLLHFLSINFFVILNQIVIDYSYILHFFQMCIQNR